MRLSAGFGFVLLLTFPALAQNTELGLGVGFGFYRDATISNSSATAQAGFGPRFVLTGEVGRLCGEHLGAEARYTFQDGDLELKSGGQEANLDGEAHSVSGELLVYGLGRKSKLRPYAAAGFGVKIYRGTEVATGPRPLTSYATLNTANQARPLLTFGGGLKFAFSERWLLRLDLRDYATPFPAGVIMPAPGARLSGWLHDFVPALGVSRSF